MTASITKIVMGAILLFPRLQILIMQTGIPCRNIIYRYPTKKVMDQRQIAGVML